jgi:protoporphyrinogen oxidase
MKSNQRDLSSFPDALSSARENSSIILGGGLAGLSAGFSLAKAGFPVSVFESDSTVGGLSKTILKDGFRFDLGGHRFLAGNEETEQFVKDILEGNFLTVSRKSKIYMRDRFFDYPLRPSNALFGLGIATTLKALSDYGVEKVKGLVRKPEHVSLEDWVMSNFGRTMFNLYFKEYSEKVWGIPCDRISKEWVSQRISGLSLGVAVKNAFFKLSGRHVKTLVDQFIYPPLGIGQISDSLKAGIEQGNRVLTDTRVTRIHHHNNRVRWVTAENCGQIYQTPGIEIISSIPLTRLVQLLSPSAPAEILEAASRLKYRDLVVVAVMIDRERITDLTWMYLPEKNMPLGRIHEPKNWSDKMAPEGKTHIVSEYFCFEGDTIWKASEHELRAVTIQQLERLGLIREKEVIGSCVVRVPKAYPVFEVGYTGHYEKIVRYLENFTNLHICGRGGMFRYYNMDHAIESGLEVAKTILEKPVHVNGKDTPCTENRYHPAPVN